MSEKLLPPEQRAMRRVIERLIVQFANPYIKAIEGARNAIALQDLAEAIGKFGSTDLGHLTLAAEIDTMVGTFVVELGPLIEKALVQAAVVGFPIFSETGPIAAGAGELSLDTFLAEVPKVVREITGDLVKAITSGQQEALKLIIDEGFAAGEAPMAIAREVKALIGLDAARVGAQLKFIAELGSESPSLEALRYAYKLRKRAMSFEDFVERYRDGIPEAQQTSWEEMAYQKRRKSRALTIARTETTSVANTVQNRIWLQAQAEGKMPAGKYVKQALRIPAAKPCPICGPLNLKYARIGGMYIGGYSSPPFHPNCLCCERLILASSLPEHILLALAA